MITCKHLFKMRNLLYKDKEHKLFYLCMDNIEARLVDTHLKSQLFGMLRQDFKFRAYLATELAQGLPVTYRINSWLA